MEYSQYVRQNSYKKKLLIQPDAGLGNRLYCLYSAFYYSQAVRRPFDIIWLRENCCNVPFDELFDTGCIPDNMSVKTTYHLGYRTGFALRTVLSNLFIKLIRKQYRYYTAEETREIFNTGGEDSFLKIFEDDEKLCIKANGKFFDVKNFHVVRDILKPSKQIKQMVFEIMEDSERSNAGCIGIHIRRTDNKNSIENSPLEAFESIMREEIAKNENTVFYLATDDEEVEREFGEKFNLINHKTFGDTKSRNSISGIKDAYVDMLCLARCDRIYGSFGSSFSEMAALIGNKEIKIVTK